jgi:hypothetical protein
MFLGTIRSESFAPMFRGLSLCAAIGSIAAVLVFGIPSSSQRTQSATWRLGAENGIGHVEFDWRPRNKLQAAR